MSYRNLASYIKQLVTGLRSITTNSDTEANVRRGIQFYARRAFRGAAVAGVTGGAFATTGDTRYIYFKTGAKKVTVNDRIVKYIGEEFSLRLYEGVTVTPSLGAITVANYRGDGGAVPTTVIMREIAAGDITGAGTEIGDPEYYFGGTAAGQRSADSIPQGRERILPANTGFIIAITMTAGNAGRFEYFLDWWEGEPQLPAYDL